MTPPPTITISVSTWGQANAGGGLPPGARVRYARDLRAWEVVAIDIRSRSRGRYVILDVDGDVDMMTAGELRKQVMAEADVDHPRVIVDLSKVSFIDAAGLGALMAGHDAVVEHDGTLSLAAPSGPARRALGICGVDHVIDVHRSVDEALGAVNGV